MTEDPTDLTGLAQKADTAELEAKAGKQRVIEDFKWLMGSMQGRRVMFHLLEMAGIYRTSFTSNGALTSFNEGKRFVGLYYVDMINTHGLNEFVLMLKEQETS